LAASSMVADFIRLVVAARCAQSVSFLFASLKVP
jgi:hypothetical protein